jgi:cbb3-type cytochrome oxidase subunit 3
VKLRANREAKQAALMRELAPSVLTAALFPCLLAEWYPRYTPQEQASFKTEKESFLPDRWWKFANGCITIPESLAPMFVKQFHKGTHSGQTTLKTTLAQHFYVPMLSSISKAVCKRCSLCVKNNPQQGSRAPRRVHSIGRTALENFIVDFTEMP